MTRILTFFIKVNERCLGFCVNEFSLIANQSVIQRGDLVCQIGSALGVFVFIKVIEKNFFFEQYQLTGVHAVKCTILIFGIHLRKIEFEQNLCHPTRNYNAG